MGVRLGERGVRVGGFVLGVFCGELLGPTVGSATLGC